MTSKERVFAALRHEPADRVPRFIWLGSALGHQLEREKGMTPGELSRHFLRNDVLQVWLSINGGMERDVPEGARFTDEWGIAWERNGGYNAVVHHPLAEADADGIRAYPFPDPLDPARYEGLDALLRDYGGEYFIGADVSGSILEPANHLRGMENVLMDIATESEEIEALFDILADFTLRVSLEALRRGAHWVWLGDDLGTQRSMLLSPDSWLLLLKPRMARIIEGIRRAYPDAPIAYHSCGSMRQVIPDLCELGIDLLNPIQESARDMDHLEIKAEFGGRLCMMCGPDTQSFLIHATPSEVYAKIRQLIRDLGASGGYLFAVSHTIQRGTPMANIEAMLRALDEE